MSRGWLSARVRGDLWYFLLSHIRALSNIEVTMAYVGVLSPSTEIRACDGSITRNVDYDVEDQKGTSWHWSESSVVRKDPIETAMYTDYGFRPYTSHWCNGTTKSATPGITVVQTMDNCYGSSAKKRITTRTGCWLTGYSFGPLPESDINAVDLQALITEAYSGATESLWDASTSFGELPQTIGHLARTVDRVNNIQNWTVDEYLRIMVKRYRNLTPKRLALKLLKEGPKGVSDLWLEYRYGWRPLVKDVEQLAKAVAHVRVGPKHSVTTGKARSIVTLQNPTLTVGQSYNGANANVKQSLSITQTCVRRDIVSVASVVPNDRLAYRVDLLTTAWELVPLSFVVDWVVDVGSFLQTASDIALRRSIRTTCCHSKTIEATALVTGFGASVQSEEEGIYVEKPVQGSLSVFNYDRKVLNPLGVPVPRWNLKVGQRPQDLRVLDLGALLSQRVTPWLK